MNLVACAHPVDDWGALVHKMPLSTAGASIDIGVNLNLVSCFLPPFSICVQLATPSLASLQPPHSPFVSGNVLDRNIRLDRRR